ncbi:MAG: hypothetical protein ACI8RZ_007598 [Myxococcota bacterium]|jgi:hypothetical protein
MRAWMILVGLALAGCDDSDPCDEYVDYICDCHPDDDCESLLNTYDESDAELQDECALALDEQQDDDDSVGHECGDSSDTGS